MANSDGYALEHRKVLYDAGVEVPPGAHVHHANGDKTDNRLSNLKVLWPRQHQRAHMAERGYVQNQHGAWAPRDLKSCERCGKDFLPWTRTSRFCSRACANKRHIRD